MKGWAAGIDVGGTWTKLVVVGPTGKASAETRVPTESTKGPEAFLDRIAVAVAELKGSRKLNACGVGIAGLVETKTGVLRAAPNLPTWKNVALGRGLGRRLKAPVTVTNDASAAAWGLYVTEAGPRSRHMAAITLGTGVGGGLVLDGKLHGGAAGFAGEIGHTTVQPGGDPCACGHKGCLEAYAGGRSIVRRFQASLPRGSSTGPEPLTPRRVGEHARAGEPRAVKAFRDAGWALGLAIHSLACVLNPDTVFLTGGVSNNAALILPELRKTLAAMPFSGPLKALKVRVSRHPNPGAFGAARLALERA